MSVITTTTATSARRELQPAVPSEPIELQAPAPEQNEHDEIVAPTGTRYAGLLAALTMALITVGLDFSMIAAAIPAITTDFNTISDIAWYYSCFRLAMCATQFLFGKLYHTLSIKAVFLASVCVLEVGALLSGRAAASPMLIVGRAIAGIGAAGVFSGCFVIIGRSFPAQQRPVYAGLGAAVEGIAMAGGPVLGGVLVDSLSWRWCFYINLPLGAVCFVLMFFTLQEPPAAAGPSSIDSRDASLARSSGIKIVDSLRELDLVGTAIFVPGITCLLLAVQWGGSTYGWTDPRAAALFALAGVLGAIFWWQERRKGDRALLPSRVVCRRGVLAGMWFAFANNSAFAVVEYYMPTYYQAVRGLSATQSGLLCLPLVIGLTTSTVIGTSLTSALGYVTPFMVLTAILSPVGAGLMTSVSLDMSLPQILAYLALFAAGVGVGLQGPQVAAITTLPPRDAPIGVAVVLFAQSLGPAIFVAAAQALFTSALHDRLSRVVLSGGSSSMTGEDLMAMGLLDIRNRVAAEDLPRVLEAFSSVLTTVFFLAVGLSCSTLLGAVAMDWVSVKKKRA
ncbi:permease of the major facilitator superfamily [Microdochium trichocladiopsis]|uniref:Permease of the major facilitator superfamily n=1 Tax=Microdochium trichocladiopsis TaxID=1682393 RepID=A0A9P9BJ05_9PEZI|nr:permease of the major facilitator superfamily [Microdochium trichocladiopsis]KAH7014146.1 permease of the major facilitator superfamily [Microdochium trichocladiopsis]